MSNDFDEIQGLDKKYKNYTQVKVDALCLNPKPSDNEKIIDDLDLAEEDIIIIELPKGKETWTFIPL